MIGISSTAVMPKYGKPRQLTDNAFEAAERADVQFVDHRLGPWAARPRRHCAMCTRWGRSQCWHHGCRPLALVTQDRGPTSRQRGDNGNVSRPVHVATASNQPSGERAIGNTGPFSIATLTVSCAGAQKRNLVCPSGRRTAPKLVIVGRTAASRCAQRLTDRRHHANPRRCQQSRCRLALGTASGAAAGESPSLRRLD